jgi:Flp pilus assembly protein TadD
VFCSLVFATHPLQVESVAWISELRGLSSAFFSLAALNVFIAGRQAYLRSPTRSRALFVASAALVVAAMLCKPSAVVLPLLVLVIDRLALGTSWGRSALAASIWGICVIPFALITRTIQHVSPTGLSAWWQRGFIAGDALVFYLFKSILPVDLCVDYGRTPSVALSHAWSYVVWAIPAALFVLSYVYRRRRPVAWLGSVAFLVLLLPVLGLMPFKYQAFSTVADRYLYLPLIGLGLIVGDIIDAAGSKVARAAASGIIVILGIATFIQTGHWLDNQAFARHTVEVNPNVAFAQNDLGGILLREGRAEEAIPHFEKAVALEPDFSQAQNNLGLALVQRGNLEEAELHFRKAVEANSGYLKAYESLGAIYLRTNRLDAAIAALQAAVAIQPSEAKGWNDLGVAFMQSGRPTDGLATFQRAVEAAPRNVTYRTNLGRALVEAGRTQEAETYLAPAN